MHTNTLNQTVPAVLSITGNQVRRLAPKARHTFVPLARTLSTRPLYAIDRQAAEPIKPREWNTLDPFNLPPATGPFHRSFSAHPFKQQEDGPVNTPDSMNSPDSDTVYDPESSVVTTLTRHLLEVGLDGKKDVIVGARALAKEYFDDPRYSSEEERLNTMITYEAIKCGTSGFLTGVMGVLALPIGIPAAIVSSFTIQTRLAGAVAALNGYDLSEPETRTRVLMTLAGKSANFDLTAVTDDAMDREMLRKFTRQFGTVRLPIALVGTVQRMVVAQVARHTAGRAATPLAGRLIPGIGGLVGAGMDAHAILQTAEAAVRSFPKK